MKRKCVWFTSVLVLWTMATAGQAVYLPLTVGGAAYYEFPQSFGFSADLDIPLSRKALHRTTRKSAVKYRFTDFYLSGHAGFYRYAFNHSAAWVAPGLAVRHSTARRFYWETRLQTGVFRTFYDGTVYAIRPDGSFSTKRFGGRLYALSGFAIALGWQTGSVRQTALFLRSGLCITYPYNSFLLPHFSIVAGVRVQPRHWNRRVLLRRKFKHAWL